MSSIYHFLNNNISEGLVVNALNVLAHKALEDQAPQELSTPLPSSERTFKGSPNLALSSI